MPKNGDFEPHLRSAYHYILDRMEADGFPWEQYDADGDGYIDSVQVRKAVAI